MNRVRLPGHRLQVYIIHIIRTKDVSVMIDKRLRNEILLVISVVAIRLSLVGLVALLFASWLV